MQRLMLIAFCVMIVVTGIVTFYGLYLATKDIHCLWTGGSVLRTTYTHRCVYYNKGGRYYEQLPPPTRKEGRMLKAVGMESDYIPDTVDRTVTY